MKEQQTLCLGFCPFISHPTWIEVLLRGLWYTVRTFSMGTLHSLQFRMKTNTSSETCISSLWDSVPCFAHMHQCASKLTFHRDSGRAWFAMFANFCGVNISTEADFNAWYDATCELEGPGSNISLPWCWSNLCGQGDVRHTLFILGQEASKCGPDTRSLLHQYCIESGRVAG